ncbi:DNA polymerase/3'-5' exonuclease PolX [bacterium]|nr:MAG: DNA polymerase/3'-5' exonuclease PolX [bacterium]
MPIHNNDIKEIFTRVADLLEIKGENQFRVRAYRNAARTIGELSQNVADMVEKGEDLTEISGIGKDLAGKIEEIVKTGTLKMLQDLEKETSPELTKLLQIPGLGAKRVKLIYEKLGITNVKELKESAEKGILSKLYGLGEKTEKKILREIGRLEESEKRFNIAAAEQIADSYIQYLKKLSGVNDVIIAGSYRRRKETVGDLDILTTCEQDTDIMEHFVKYEDVSEVISKGNTKSSVILRSGIQVDIRVFTPESYGSALLYFTGSKAHNIAIRKIAQEMGLKINEYGVFKTDKKIAGKSEEEVYKQIDLPYIPPELRENRGEIESARKGKLPNLLELGDIRGDLHIHTEWSDGHFTIEEMAEAARERGYEYIAITEHSRHTSVANGLTPERLAQQIRRIDEINHKLDGITILKGIEVDILEDGSLDLPDEILSKLDIVICSVHYKFNLSRKEQTARIINALQNPYTNVLGHPTGRMINKREPYQVDMEKIIKCARDNNCFLELNSHPDRLDLNDIHCKMAKQMGVKIAISTDAHSINGLDYMRYGIGQGRRGWLEPHDVINTRTLSELQKLLKK